MTSWNSLFFLALSFFAGASVTWFYSRTLQRRKLRPLLKDVSYSLSNLMNSASQIQTVSRDVSESSNEQLASLNTSASASEEIAAMTANNSQHTQDLLKDAESLNQFSRNGLNQIQNMVRSSLKINEGSSTLKTEMEEIIQQLEGSFKIINDIAGKTKLINEIVFQTRLLSFNASVEAARAGEAGKGFAVVAEEVGKLAEMSGSVSNEIAGIVEKSVSMVKETIEATRRRIDSISQMIYRLSESGLSETKECEKIFAQINERIARFVPVVEGITHGSKEQSLGVENLNQSLSALQELSSRNRLVASQTIEYGSEFERETLRAQKAMEKLESISSIDHGETDLREFEWNNSLVLGVGEMDQEHRELVDRINDLIRHLDRGSAKNDIDLSFKELANFVVHHFQDEESFMESINYPQIDSHKKIHERLLQQVGDYKKALDEGRIDKIKLVGFLRNWLISHIMGVDRQYAEHSKNRRHNHLRAV